MLCCLSINVGMLRLEADAYVVFNSFCERLKFWIGELGAFGDKKSFDKISGRRHSFFLLLLK